MSDIHWQMADADAPTGTPGSFREGIGLEHLLSHLREHIALVTKDTPEGYIPSGNVSLYWTTGEHKGRSRPRLRDRTHKRGKRFAA